MSVLTEILISSLFSLLLSSGDEPGDTKTEEKKIQIIEYTTTDDPISYSCATYRIKKE